MIAALSSGPADTEAIRLMIAGGGTGGHLYMGIALARELQSRHPSHEAVFVGTQRGLEARIVPGEGFRLETISSAGLKGIGVLHAARNFMIIPKSLYQSRRLIRQSGPRVVVGVGGYASGPVVLAAWWLGRPTLIIEPNAYPGLTNRWLARVVDRAALAFPDRGGYFGSKAEVTGIPVRNEFFALPPRAHEPGRIRLLIYGGSQGSQALNRIVCQALPSLRDIGPSVSIVHQTGERQLEAVRRAYGDAGVQAEIRPFLTRIFEEFARADLIISRSGASTVAEITAAGKAAILVPFPGATDDHQVRNALSLEQQGAARMIREQEWDPGRLAREIRRYLGHPEEIAGMEAAARRLGRPGATGRIADIVEELALRRRAGAPEAYRN
jgi:UDP-N-acetylglucosamine--N-acetylmuramyl-(pentapeptide) pyrophosphoryl-undecaprenol N-acetylglucosamine transferase